MIRVGLVLRVEVRTWEFWLPALQDLSKTGYGYWGMRVRDVLSCQTPRKCHEELDRQDEGPCSGVR